MTKPRNKWTHCETLTLLEIWGREDIQACLDKTSKDKKTYRRISYELLSLGYERNAVQVKEKIKALKKTYKACKDQNGRSGCGRQTIEYFDVLDNILGHRPAVNPPTIVLDSVAWAGDHHAPLPAADGDANDDGEQELDDSRFGLDESWIEDEKEEISSRRRNPSTSSECSSRTHTPSRARRSPAVTGE